MFQKDNAYDITMLTEELGEDLVETTYPNRTVVKVDFPLIQLSDGTIINSASLRFVKAKES